MVFFLIIFSSFINFLCNGHFENTIGSFIALFEKKSLFSFLVSLFLSLLLLIDSPTSSFFALSCHDLVSLSLNLFLSLFSLVTLVSDVSSRQSFYLLSLRVIISWRWSLFYFSFLRSDFFQTSMFVLSGLFSNSLWQLTCLLIFVFFVFSWLCCSFIKSFHQINQVTKETLFVSCIDLSLLFNLIFINFVSIPTFHIFWFFI